MAAATSKPPKIAEGRSYANVLRREAKPYERLELIYIKPKIVEGKPVIEIPRRVMETGRER